MPTFDPSALPQNHTLEICSVADSQTLILELARALARMAAREDDAAENGELAGDLRRVQR